tara:strand:- start:589 stop:864 length:276 start_codon:yes stop_codon:yes gene_type:complete
MNYDDEIKEYFSKLGRTHWQVRELTNGWIITHKFDSKDYTELGWEPNEYGKAKLIAYTKHGRLKSTGNIKEFLEKLEKWMESDDGPEDNLT